MLPISKALGRITPMVMLPFDNPFYKRFRQALFEINKTFKFYNLWTGSNQHGSLRHQRH